MAKTLISWYLENKRDLPWRKTQDPYRIWLSEIILQQTRVDQGLNYYKKFVSEFPNVKSLANSSEQKVLNMWQGLGYYSRARNLLYAAKQVVALGQFPDSAKELLKLKGIGNYTASAIASIAFNEVTPVIDGNVYRVVSRLFQISDPIDVYKSRKIFLDLLEDLIPPSDPANFNQAMMELGATVCKPQNPDCVSCPISHKCLSFSDKSQRNFPVKLGKIKIRKRLFNYFHIEDEENVWLRHRVTKDIWQNMYDFHLEETDFLFDNQKAEKIARAIIGSDNELISISESPVFKHILTHQRIESKFWKLSVNNGFEASDELHLRKIKKSEIVDYPIPKLVENYLGKVPL